MKRIRVLLVAAVAAVAVACASSSNSIVPTRPPITVPDWLSEGTGAFRGEGSRKLQGVGVASDIANPMARRKQADAAAREKLQADGDELAVAVLEMDEFRRALHRLEGDENTRLKMAANADRAFDQLAPR